MIIQENIKKYIALWERRCYSEGLPDEAPREIDDMVPSYRRIVMAILKNDPTMIGVTRPKSVYYGILKRIEIEGRKNLHSKVLHEQAPEGTPDMHDL